MHHVTSTIMSKNLLLNHMTLSRIVKIVSCTSSNLLHHFFSPKLKSHGYPNKYVGFQPWVDIDGVWASLGGLFHSFSWNTHMCCNYVWMFRRGIYYPKSWDYYLLLSAHYALPPWSCAFNILKHNHHFHEWFVIFWDERGKIWVTTMFYKQLHNQCLKKNLFHNLLWNLWRFHLQYTTNTF